MRGEERAEDEQSQTRIATWSSTFKLRDIDYQLVLCVRIYNMSSPNDLDHISHMSFVLYPTFSSSSCHITRLSSGPVSTSLRLRHRFLFHHPPTLRRHRSSTASSPSTSQRLSSTACQSINRAVHMASPAYHRPLPDRDNHLLA